MAEVDTTDETKKKTGRDGVLKIYASVNLLDDDNECTVPHMNTKCITNSLAYRTMLSNPDVYLNNLHNLPLDAQNRVRQHCQEMLEMYGEGGRHRKYGYQYTKEEDLPKRAELTLLQYNNEAQEKMA